MSIWMTFKVALRALLRNKVRSMLTALGIIIGIAAVISVVAIGEGASANVREQISTIGDNLVIVGGGSSKRGGVRGGAGGVQTLMASDGEAMMKDNPDLIKAFTPLVRSSGQAVYHKNNWGTQFQGVTPAFVKVRKWAVSEGAFFTDSDVRAATRVCVIGQTLVDMLFDGNSPVGETFRIGNMPFKVLGVLQKKGTNAMGQDQDDLIVVPYTTVRRVLKRGSFNNVDQLHFSLYDMDQLDEAKLQLAALLRQRHRLSEDADDDFTIVDMTEITTMATNISKMLTLLMVVVASISLLVGGIGIMNIMLVSVAERTREIGLRAAVGATPAAILAQFLAESVMLSIIGGVLGVLSGVAWAHAVGRVNSWPITVTPPSVIIAVVFSAGVGVFFGFYPALRASRLNPIDCLRYE